MEWVPFTHLFSDPNVKEIDYESMTSKLGKFTYSVDFTFTDESMEALAENLVELPVPSIFTDVTSHDDLDYSRMLNPYLQPLIAKTKKNPNFK